MRHHRPFALTTPFSGTFIVAVLLASVLAGVGVGVGLTWAYGLTSSTSILLCVALASMTTCLGANLLRRALIQAVFTPERTAPRLESTPQRFGFRRVFGVHLSRKASISPAENTYNPEIYAETTRTTGEFQPATIVYEVPGGYANSDTFHRDQALANARQALLSMDHTKQIPH
jgi:hypothetical protein